MKTTKEILQMVLDRIQEGDCICDTIKYMRLHREITTPEFSMTLDFMYDNKPKWLSTYQRWWPRNDIESRKKWLQERINEL